jgi:hypothetical protein
MPKSADRLQRFARERADDEARRIPWQRLYDARNQYLDWQEFQLWVRSILEVENEIPNWLVEVLNTSCPGFLESEKRLMPKGAKNRSLPIRLEDWIDNHVFAFARQEGWLNALIYYAVRDPRYQRAEVCWSECVEKWKKAKPIRYPLFDEWKGEAAQCDETAHLTAGERKASASAKFVHPTSLLGGCCPLYGLRSSCLLGTTRTRKRIRISRRGCVRVGAPMPPILGRTANSASKGVQWWCARLGGFDALDRRPLLPGC